MQSLRRKLYSVEEYLALERVSETRHELVNGEIIAMAGGTLQHNAICANLVATITYMLRGKPCRAYTSDQRVAVPPTKLYTYPDVTVICDEPVLSAADTSTITNPVLLVEVLSPSSEQYDRGAKFAHYQKLPSLKEYFLVSQSERRVEHYRLLDDGQWIYSACTQGVVESLVLGGAISLDDVYDKVDLSSGLANGQALG
jgi:Uma2 family endonuclease